MTMMRNDNAFTGLEAAIVLIAFVVVAAVFSYVVLGAGFFTTQKSQEVVHTGVQQASSSMEVIGQVYGHADSTTTESTAAANLAYIRFTIGNTAGGTGLDVTQMVVSYADETTRDADVEYQTATGSTLTDLLKTKSAQTGANADLYWGVIEKINQDDDNILEPGEQFVIGATMPATAKVNVPFTLNLQPTVGAVFSVKKTVPASIDAVTLLY
ncbi:MAG: Flagellin domain protein [Methanomicrobiales archaeon 53_19]|nr:MAG: Flagellin domain protein [Methanomicrobiales archaeon 53_19]